MQKLSTQKRAAILRCLIEGTSVSAAARITGSAKNTILDFLVEAGEACAEFQNETLRNLSLSVLQLDEVWSFVGCREKSKRRAAGIHPGDVWTWTSICAETKLMPAWYVGDRTGQSAYAFCEDLSARLTGTGSLQITSDGHPAYTLAVGYNFDPDRLHFAQLVKVYGKNSEGYDVVIRADKQPVLGSADLALVSTSYVERANLTIRMGNRRFTRLTNAFSKKLENHCHQLAIHFMNYNFCRKHMSIGVTPAVAAKVADHQWTIEEVVRMIDARAEAKLNARFEAEFAARGL